MKISNNHFVKLAALWWLVLALAPAPTFAQTPDALAQAYTHEVRRRLAVPPATRAAYGTFLQHALDRAGLHDLAGEYVVMVDRAPKIQAIFVFYRGGPDAAWELIGASPVSTGLPGTYDHFLTPLGVFRHTPDNMDFRAEGTFNENGIRGYGVRGMRVFDFGWVDGERGWGEGGTSAMRLQMHATDPDRLAQRLGHPASKGCIRIPASLNRFLDHYGILDADYNALLAAGDRLWVLEQDHVSSHYAGRYLVIIDSERDSLTAE